MTVPLPDLGEALRDRYVLQRELGRGGMAIVYARDLDARTDVYALATVLYEMLAR